jgi:hypothetical protein
MAGAALAALALFAANPDPGRAALIEAWRSGDLVAAGQAARVLLDPERLAEGSLPGDGDVLAFVAAVGARAEGQGSEEVKHFWMVTAHARFCEPSLDPALRDLAAALAALPGRSPGLDRFFISHPYRTLESAECTGDAMPPLHDMMPPSGAGDVAVVYLKGRTTRSGMLRNVELVFDYPPGAGSRLRDVYDRQRTYWRLAEDQWFGVTLDPCYTTLQLERNNVEICRPGHDPAAP